MCIYLFYFLLFVVRLLTNILFSTVPYSTLPPRSPFSSNLMYCDIFCSKYGSSFFTAMKSLILRPKELAIESTIRGDVKIYGPNVCTNNIMMMGYEGTTEKLRKNIDALKNTYQLSLQNSSVLE